MWASPWGRARLIAVGVWALMTFVCTSIGIWHIGRLNALGAHFAASRGGEGSVYLTIRNSSTERWTDVLLDADGLYYARTGEVEVGREWDIRVGQLVNRNQIPRPGGLFAWESRHQARPFPSAFAPPDHVPRLLTLQTSTATVVHRLQLP
jgi:hypothetical protein